MRFSEVYFGAQTMFVAPGHRAGAPQRAGFSEKRGKLRRCPDHVRKFRAGVNFKFRLNVLTRLNQNASLERAVFLTCQRPESLGCRAAFQRNERGAQHGLGVRLHQVEHGVGGSGKRRAKGVFFLKIGPQTCPELRRLALAREVKCADGVSRAFREKIQKTEV